MIKMRKQYFSEVALYRNIVRCKKINTISDYVMLSNYCLFQVWNIMQLFALGFFLIAMGFYINRSLWTTKLVEEVMNNRGNNQTHH